MRLSSRAYSTYGRRTLSWVWVSQGSWMHAFLIPHPTPFFFCFHFSGRPFSVSSLWFQLFVIVVWNFELYMIPLALLLPLVWNYILLVSGKDTRQDVVSNLIASLVSPQRRIKPTTSFLETWYYLTQMHESNLRHCHYFNSNNVFSVVKNLVT